MHRVLGGTIVAIDVSAGVRPDLLESNVAIPGDAGDNIDVVEIRWDLVDICPAGSPDIGTPAKGG